MWRIGVTVLYGASLWAIWNTITCFQLTLSIIALCIVLLGPHTLWVIHATSKRDLKALYRYACLRWRIRQLKKRDIGLPAVFQENVRKHPDKVAFYFEDQQWTFKQVEDFSNRIANYFKTLGVKHGDCVALYMSNCVEYIGIWLGLSKLGAVPALINNNLHFKSLTHCINIVDSIMVITDVEGQIAFEEIKEEMGDMKVFVSGASPSKSITYPNGIDLDQEIKSFSTTCPPEVNSVKFADKMVYIYTSGTTGLPKAAVIKHSRCFFASLGAKYMIGFNDRDVVYSPLPLYHLASGILGACQSLVAGASVVVKRKFSVSKYWTDCITHNVTVAQYIGEICRYLLNTPPKPEDTQHKVKIMFGNGLRPQIWNQFQERFGVSRISEFYGATEGNANIINMDGKPGAIGFLSVLLPSFYPCCLIKIDSESGKPLRDKNGVCVRCVPGEPGEFVGRIVRNDPVRDFHGYADKKATESKIVNDVWKKGDLAFLSGDILVMDEEGYLYFKDRRGDTFRWRGENVSTTEVEGIVSQVADMADCVVFGVEVPGSEGKAGMAAILDPEKKVDLVALLKGLQAALPSYAQPLFLRMVTKMDMTGTYKLKKIHMQKDGFNRDVVSDDLYFLDTKKGAYVPITKELFDKIQNQEMRL